MLIGVNVVPDVRDGALAASVERLGFDSYYVGDNPVMWSDPYVTLAIAARATERIRLGTMVSVAGVRSPIVTANALATINRLAPGRVTCGVGTGNTARRMMGSSPMSVATFERYVVELRALLAGEEVLRRVGDREVWLGHASGARDFVAFDPPIPLVVSAFGPRAMALAGRLGDGVVGGIGDDPADVADAWALVAQAAAAAGRELDPERFYTGSVVSMCVLRDGEGVDSPRVVDELGAAAMSALQYAYEQHRLMGTPPPEVAADIWDDYVATVERVPPERRHQRIHEGSSTWLVDDDRRFVTAELLEATCMIGTPAELAGRLDALAATGLVSEVIIAPVHAVTDRLVHDVAEQVLPLLGCRR